MQVESDKLKYFKAKDGRTVAVLVRGDLEEYSQFPPKIDTEEDRAHMARHYDLSKIDMDTYTKAHLTDNELPLQIILLNREVGSRVKPHYHKVSSPLPGSSKFQLMMCQRGLGRIGVYTREGGPSGRRGPAALRFHPAPGGPLHRVSGGGHQAHRAQAGAVPGRRRRRRHGGSGEGVKAPIHEGERTSVILPLFFGTTKRA